MINLKLIAIGIAVFTIGSVVFAGYQYVTNLQQENKSLASNLESYKLANQTLSAERDTLNRNLEISKAEQQKLNDSLSAAREQMGRMTKLFADHDFTTLAQKKPGLITIKMKKATDALFKEIEKESKQ